MKHSTLLFILLLSVLNVMGQEKKPKWFVPDHATVQYAGSMGMFSAGAGYTNRSDKSHLDFFMGYVPKKNSYNRLGVATVKYTQSVWKSRDITEHWSYTPLTVGVFITYTFGKHFQWPEQYPSGYYWWSESLRPNIFIGGNIRYTFTDTNIRRITLYYELGTNELKLTSYLVNSNALSFWDVLHAGVGAKVSF